MATIAHTAARAPVLSLHRHGRRGRVPVRAQPNRPGILRALRESQTGGALSSFEAAKEHVWRLGLKTKEEWWEWERSGQRPGDIPSHPDRIYRDEGWEGWEDWLGVGKGGTHVEEFRPFEEARDYVHTLGMKNIREWMLWSGSGERPADVPWAPDHTYADKWEGWEDWLGSER
mmetsp:Transcript_30020/g.53718  ORF Transcript_30020/g.53718 Transcript_30020/m.53718 type:complete len:173 (-) Transcript_30020:215-733(-)|eukprot:CAMPEP_0177767474 /NCGR_PEP_ID=MMETSP0491_2-20121128/9133_1 /TAXON_ID=63592 /ORGANISM="Tetraselmis chuii, Strain PLY429" /LENGTH=172 /DNA_ID=CAMNT_0019284069 /DNA_START=432 /DNA_END=950 /DNA_ORIENTATION=+